MKYQGENWETVPSSKWFIDFVDEREKITAKKIGTRKLSGIKANVYACDQCPHTFYAD